MAASGRRSGKPSRARSPFRDRYVLASGFPWAIGTDPYHTIGMTVSKVGIEYRRLDFPKELWRKDVPQYRLILEKVHKRSGRTS